MTTLVCLAENHLSISVWRAGMAPCSCLYGSTVPAAVHTPRSGLIFNGQSWWLLPGHPWGPLSCPVSLSSVEMSRLIHLLLCCSCLRLREQSLVKLPLCTPSRCALLLQPRWKKLDSDMRSKNQSRGFDFGLGVPSYASSLYGRKLGA